MDPVEGLDIKVVENPTIIIPLRLTEIEMPDWAKEWSVDGKLLVPIEATKDNNDWRSVDWWLAMFLMLEGWHERVWEEQKGSIHSYSFRLLGWDNRLWKRAWGNRIALFIRCWASQNEPKTADELLGPLPKPEILLSHDVDAIAKTIPIRIKQAAFLFFNMMRDLKKRQFIQAKNKLTKMIRFIVVSEDWQHLTTVIGKEAETNIKARFHFYADQKRKKSFKRWLFDPSYEIDSPRMREIFIELKQCQHQIGLHPSYDTWETSNPIAQQKKYLEKVLESGVCSARQHWLRFSWRRTWVAQQDAGLAKDTTLMFNDRAGFRTGSAIAWYPWHADFGNRLELEALPTTLMDSHIFDYDPMPNSERRKEMKYWVDECKFVRGQMAILWHPHTLSKDYNWGSSFDDLLKLLIED